MAEHEQRCRDLKRKLRTTQEQNEVIYSMIERTKKMIQRARLERSLLLEKLDQVSKNPNVEEDQEENTPPQSPAGSAENGKEASQSNAADTTAGASAKRTGGNKLPNAYTVFCDEERDSVIKTLEETGVTIKTGLVQSNLSDRWKALSKEQKKPYSERARELKKKKGNVADQSEDTEDESTRDPKEELKEETEEPQDFQSTNNAMSEPPSELASEPASEPPMEDEEGDDE